MADLRDDYNTLSEHPEQKRSQFWFYGRWFFLIAAGCLPLGFLIGRLTVPDPEPPPAPPDPSSVAFGHPMKVLFGLDPDIIFINHGSYGTTSNPVMQAVAQFNMMEERNSQYWFDTVQGRLPAVQQALAQYIDAPRWDVSGDSVALIASASDGVNAVLRSWLNPGDKVLVNTWTYGMVLKTIDYLNERGLEIEKVVVNLTLPCTNAGLVASFKKAFEDHPDTRLAVIDHISSGPAVVFPIKEIQALARSRNITVLFDGAHAVGQIPLSLKDIDPDFYLSNIHKWLLGAKATAFLYVRANLQPFIHPTIVSHNYHQGFAKEFAWTGTRSYSAHLAIQAALDFRSSIGEMRHRNYNNQLCHQASSLFFARWNVSSPVEESMCASLVMVPIPCNVPTDRLCYNWTAANVTAQLTAQGIWAWPNYVTDGSGITRYIRLSCQIYNEMSDYQAFFEAFTKITGTPTTR